LYNYSDDPLWLVVSTASYIKETGDFSILDEKVPFAVKELSVPKQMGHHSYLEIFKAKKKKTARVATIYEHLKRGILYVAKNDGPHGLPKMLFADWNDCLNLLGPKNNAESVFVAEFLVFVCKEMRDLLSHWNIPKKKKEQEIKILSRIEKTMTRNVNKYAWDGKWYKRAYTDKGKAVGSKKSKYAKIFLETQPWAVISGVADKKRSEKCMDSVFKYLATKFGITLLYPPFREYQPELGEISTYLPGLKENASIFCHPNPWAMIAECMLGRGDLAYDYYRAILPSAQNSIADLRKVEPYVYCQMIAGKHHKDFGQGKNSWLTGSAAWNFVAVTQYILGIRPDYDGLLIDPCLPKDLKRCEIFRNFRGDRYTITVFNPEARNEGVKSIRVDGQVLYGNKIKPFGDGEEHSVEVEIG
jgi:cellobiose phosphorylase